MEVHTSWSSRRVGMRGESEGQATLPLGLTPDGLVPENHRLWRIKPLVDSVLARTPPVFDDV